MEDLRLELTSFESWAFCYSFIRKKSFQTPCDHSPKQHTFTHLHRVCNFSFMSTSDASKLTIRHLVNAIYNHIPISHYRGTDKSIFYGRPICWIGHMTEILSRWSILLVKYLVFYKAMESVDIHSRDLSTSSIVKSDSSLFSKKSN